MYAVSKAGAKNTIVNNNSNKTNMAWFNYRLSILHDKIQLRTIRICILLYLCPTFYNVPTVLNNSMFPLVHNTVHRLKTAW